MRCVLPSLVRVVLLGTAALPQQNTVSVSDSEAEVKILRIKKHYSSIGSIKLCCVSCFIVEFCH